ncbi:MAG: hypothetical protein RLZZ124_60 [Cyanobacteriota bacterium]|jgi:hypothetical protein
MNPLPARLLLSSDRSKQTVLDPKAPLTIGRAAGNRLQLLSVEGVSDHHAVVRFSRHHGWLVCEWQSSDGTFLEEERIRQCRPLSDGDQIRLGRRGPTLIFELIEQGARRAERPSGPPPPRPADGATARPTTAAGPGATTGAAPRGGGDQPPRRPGSTTPRRPSPAGSTSIDINGQQVRLDQIRSAVVISEPRHPHIFSWWLLLCLGGLLLLPFPLIFWPLELGALAGWILLGSRKEHTLLVVQQDGQAMRRSFANKVTALAHRNGIRKAIGQSLQQS